MAIEKRLVHFDKQKEFNEAFSNEEIKDESIVFINDSRKINTHKAQYKTITWGNIGKTIEFIFNQTGEAWSPRVTPVFDTGLLDYLLENIKCYQGKYQEDGSMMVLPLNVEIGSENSEYDIKPVSYLDGSELTLTEENKNDFFVQLPNIYYKSTEIESDIFKIKFSTYPFNGCHKVFGPDTLIGIGSGFIKDNGFYANGAWQGKQITFSQAKEYLANRGSGYYGITSDEMGVLMFLQIYQERNVNGNVLTVGNRFLGVHCVFTNGNDGRMYPPNIEINNAVAKVTHLDGNIEYLHLPYIWGQGIKKLYIGEYLNILPKEAGQGIYNTSDCWIGNSDGIAIYFPSGAKWRICGDRNDEQGAQESGVKLKIRPCFKGKIIETTDVEYFKSLPIIN